jgi:PST family polysaccharide transporter
MKSNLSTKSGLSGILWNSSGSIIQMISQFLVIAVLSRLLTPREFGVVGVILILFNFSKIFTDLGIASAIIQIKHLTKKHISLGYSYSIILGSLVGLLFYAFAPFVASFFNLVEADKAIRFFSLFFPIYSFNGVTISLLHRNLKFATVVKCNLISYIFGTGLISIVLAYYGWSYWALVIGQFSGLIISTLLLVIFLPPFFSLKYDKTVSRDLLVFGSGHTLGTIFNYFAENMDNIITGRMLSTVALGNYSKAFQLFSIPTGFFGGVFDKVFFPLLSKNQDKKDSLSRFYLLSTSLCFGILLPISILIFINADLIVKLLLGEQWDVVPEILRILIIGMAFRFGTRINKSYLKSLGLVFKGAYYQLIFASLMLLFCLIGSYYYGLSGVAYGVFLATTINYFQMTRKVYFILDFSKTDFIKIHWKTYLCNLPFVLFSLFLYSQGIHNIWIHFGLTILVYIPMMILFLFNKKYVFLNPSNAQILKQIFRALPKSLQHNLIKLKILESYFRGDEN